MPLEIKVKITKVKFQKVQLFFVLVLTGNYCDIYTLTLVTLNVLQVWVTADLVWYCYRVCLQISEYLHIEVFRITTGASHHHHSNNGTPVSSDSSETDKLTSTGRVTRSKRTLHWESKFGPSNPQILMFSCCFTKLIIDRKIFYNLFKWFCLRSVIILSSLIIYI